MDTTTFIAAAAAGSQGNMIQTLVMVGFLGVFFYLFMICPEQKRRKKMENMRKSLKKVHKVIAMGMKAVVDEVREKTVILKQIDGDKIEMLTQAISDIEPAESKQEVKQNA